MKFIQYFDYEIGAGSYEYVDLKAKTIEEAIEEAEYNCFNRNGIYLTRIMKKIGNEKHYREPAKIEVFEAILCKRSHGWHRNIKENSEREHRVQRWSLKEDVWFEYCD